ncbi:MAG: 3-dehydroquinate synthase, partial [Zoogloea sp.]|nr:3-dehydroquinate synthase [Zoogloea sp.]
DLPFLDWIETHLDQLLARDPETLAEAVERSCRNKAEVVAADETEQGERATLNLGHTFGHAIETGLGYGEWLHGEAVAAGTIMAADLSRRLGWLTDDEVARVRLIHERAGLPVRGPALGADRYLELMSHDKKVSDGTLRLVLLKGVGRAVISAEATPDQMRESIEACCANPG